ncbi:MAG: glycosyltransferase, partial [Candidatus Nanopelagicales bacterium]
KEGWGLVVMEAASRGVPAVAYAEAGGVNESIVHGETGILVNGDERDFVEAIDHIISDGDLRVRLGERARRRSLDFSWDASALAFESVLRQAIAQRRN